MLLLYKDAILKKITEGFPKTDDGLVQLILFGSVARDEYSPLSDVDILLVTKDKPKTQKSFSNFAEQIYLDTCVVVSPKYLTPQEYKASIDPFIKTIRTEGKVLWRRKVK